MDILIVCTGNTCRSPMALGFARLWASAHGVDATFRSAGLLPSGNPATPDAVQTMSEHGIDISSHTSTQVTRELLGSHDLIIAMAANHVRAVVPADPGLWPRTFTLKELARRTEAAGPRRASESLSEYLTRCGSDRNPSDLASMESAHEDVEDPIGHGLESYRLCAEEIRGLIEVVLEQLFP